MAFFFFQAEDGIRDIGVTGVQTCALPILATCTDEVFELRRLGLTSDRVSIVPCGVDTSVFTPRGPVAPRSDRPRLLVLGRLVERKGQDDAVRALTAVPDAELVVVGGPPAGELDADPEVRRLRAV